MLGVSVNILNPSQSVSANQTRVSTIIMVGTHSSGSTNTAESINTLSEFETKFGTSSPSYPFVRYLFRNDGNTKLIFIRGLETGTPTVTQNLLKGINIIPALITLPSSVLLCPEMNTLSQSDKTSVATAMQSAASSSKPQHVALINTMLASNTKALALTERALYGGSHLSLYYGYYKDPENNNIPVCLHAAFVACLKSKNEGSFEPPAGYGYPTTGINGLSDTGFLVTTEADFNDFQNNNINTAIPAIQPISTSGGFLFDNRFVIGMSRLLTDVPVVGNINTRIAVNLFSYATRLIAASYLQSSADPDNRRQRDFHRSLYGLCEDYLLAGAFNSAGQGDKPYKIEVMLQGSGSRKTLRAKVYAVFVGCIEGITIDLYPTSVSIE